MHKPSIYRLFLALVALSLFISDLTAQEDPSLNREFSVLEVKTAFAIAPNVDGPRKSIPSERRRSNWMEIEAEFGWIPNKEDAKNPFLDELTAEFYMMLETGVSKEEQRVLLTGKTVLTNVAANKSKMFAAMYVSPRAMERLFGGRPPAAYTPALVSATGVVLSRGGKKVAVYSSKQKFLFWESPEPTTKVIEGGLLPRSKTPFAFSSWDYYEEEKTEK